MWRRVWWVALCVGCGPGHEDLPPLEPAPMLEVCGQPSPVRILELEADQGLVSEASSAVRVADRLYLVVGRSSNGSFDEGAVAEETIVMSTGPCGEDPRLVAEGVTRVFTRTRYPGLVLGNTAGGVVVIDPDGVAAPELLLPFASSQWDWTDAGVVGRANVPDVGDALVLQPYADVAGGNIPPPVVLHAPWPGLVRVHGNDVFYSRDDGVYTIALPEGEPERITTEAQWYEVTTDGRWFVWWTPSDGRGLTKVYVLDRSTGETVLVGELDGFVDVHDTGIMLRPRGWPEDAVHSVVRFPSFQRVDLPESVAVVGPANETQWIAWRNPRSWMLFDTESGTAEQLFGQFGFAIKYVSQLEVLVSDRPGDPHLDNQGTLYAAPFDGSGNYVLADRATPGIYRVGDGRIVTPLDVEHNVASLAVTDGQGATRWLIDTDALVWFTRWQRHSGYDPDVVLYSVTDGARSGVWLARLPAE